ncbi:MAG TPA: Lrp/AsnC family transcriptional regulator [Syntrophothermus lipocalidus]|uniref:siroheme decarboxylase n=1 Tax=Syntrophothermus lipocalidus (strain DSM 12680 / TGB-C1) TaxID=643648 RepID=D7CNA0_SYNLT|nr:AsnC family transcriptional regulator [Syntrophothermus lipocalidus]ADI02185.1 putative transcriptional regulator, AsnC family [Syntrophothermus lipocalidus DSM 12680]HHV75972.1 Lrp/AsnC family transcriptional regulator [Syntrophothermus lipocalidus]HOV42712.1 AsnC family transcriptional regulator [Syntrophothermus lipocalidus]
MDKVDRKILEVAQQEFPLQVRPWAEIAAEIGISETELLDRIRKLKELGVIRRIGAVFDSRKLGFYSTLCAAKVDPKKLEEVAAYINTFPGVTHNYERDDEYNLWFTLTASSSAEAERQLRDIEENCGIKIMRLPARKVYKIEVVFNMDGAEDNG